MRKSIFTSIAQAGDRRPQANPEPSPYTLDIRTLLPKVNAALFVERTVNVSELKDIADVLPHAGPQPVVSR